MKTNGTRPDFFWTSSATQRDVENSFNYLMYIIIVFSIVYLYVLVQLSTVLYILY